MGMDLDYGILGFVIGVVLIRTKKVLVAGVVVAH